MYATDSSDQSGRGRLGIGIQRLAARFGGRARRRQRDYMDGGVRLAPELEHVATHRDLPVDTKRAAAGEKIAR